MKDDFSQVFLASESQEIVSDDSNFKIRKASSSLAISSYVAIICFSALVLMFLFSDSLIRVSNVKLELKVVKPTTSTTSTLAWTLNRHGYDPLNYFTSDASSFLYYRFLRDGGYNAIIEPSAPMDLYIEDYGVDSDYSAVFTVKKSVDPGSEDIKVGEVSANGDTVLYKKVSVDCTPFDEYDIEITKVTVTFTRYSLFRLFLGNLQTTDAGDTSTFTGKAICLYVRREIRDLSDEDVSVLMDAMYKLWVTSDEEGQSLYGPEFHNITYLLQMHHFNAAWPDADHFHEGNGFLAQHIKMTNIFENVIQLIDPSLTIPYWDFTIDSEEDLRPHESPVMSPEMFGSMRPPSDQESDIGYTYAYNNVSDFAILDGRWAYTKAEMNPHKFSGIQAAYGYMRSPWNLNPSPYVSRFTGSGEMPKCSTHLDMLDYTDLMTFFIKVEVGPHASVHGTNGGSFGCDRFDPLVANGAIKDERNKQAVCSLWIFTLKALYRKDYILPQKSCDLPDNANDAFCPFSCKPGVEEDIKTSLFNKLVSTAVPDEMSIDQEESWLSFVCGGDAATVYGGDHAESASPSDPSFWPIHPTLERLFHAKMMVGGFETSEWSTDESDVKVCTRYECYENGVYDRWAKCCDGHYEDSQMLDFESGNFSGHWGPRNGETILATDPTSKAYSMPYIYDRFTWDHCSSAAGGDINNKLKALNEARSPATDDDQTEDVEEEEEEEDKTEDQEDVSVEDEDTDSGKDHNKYHKDIKTDEEEDIEDVAVDQNEDEIFSEVEDAVALTAMPTEEPIDSVQTDVAVVVTVDVEEEDEDEDAADSGEDHKGGKDKKDQSTEEEEEEEEEEEKEQEEEESTVTKTKKKKGNDSEDEEEDEEGETEEADEDVSTTTTTKKKVVAKAVDGDTTRLRARRVRRSM